MCVTVLKCVQATAVCHGGVRAASHRTRPGECWLSTWSYQTAARTLITSQTRDTLSVLSHTALTLTRSVLTLTPTALTLTRSCLTLTRLFLTLTRSALTLILSALTLTPLPTYSIDTLGTTV